MFRIPSTVVGSVILSTSCQACRETEIMELSYCTCYNELVSFSIASGLVSITSSITGRSALPVVVGQIQVAASNGLVVN